MSSEHRYDYSYEQFVLDSLPSFDLFGEPTRTSTTSVPSYESQEDYLPDLNGVGESFFSGTYIFDQNPQFQPLGDIARHSPFDAFAAPQHSASSVDGSGALDLATTVTGVGFCAGDLREPDHHSTVLANIAGHSRTDFGGFEASQAFTESTEGVSPTAVAMPNDDVETIEPLDLSPIRPIIVSFFFSTTLTRRTVCILPNTEL